VALEGVEQLVGKAFDAVGAGDVTVARAPEGQRVDQGFAEDDFAAGDQRFDVEDASAPTFSGRQIQVFRGAGAQVVAQFFCRRVR